MTNDINSLREAQELKLAQLNEWLINNPEHPDRLINFKEKLRLDTELGKNKYIGITKS
jgi:hypothetical protein